MKVNQLQQKNPPKFIKKYFDPYKKILEERLKSYKTINKIIKRTEENSISLEEVKTILRKEKPFKVLAVNIGPFRCNFNCKICYTSSMKGKRYGSNVETLLKIIKELTEYGIKLLYIPGLGEPFLTKQFLELIENKNLPLIEDKKLPIIVFTNGTFFEEKNKIKKLVEEWSNLYIYVKWWSTDEKKASVMVGRKRHYSYDKIDGVGVPSSLKMLLEEVGKDRIGVEIVVTQENFDEVNQVMIPFLKENNIISFIETLIPTGKGMDKLDLLLREEQLRIISPYLASGGELCPKRLSWQISVNGNYLVPGLALNNGIKLRENGKEMDVIKELFFNEFFRNWIKLSIGDEKNEGVCICRYNKRKEN